MIAEIICKWWSEELNLGVTETKEVYTLINNNPILLLKEFHMNRPHFRIPGTSKRYSDLRINKSVKLANKVIQSYCPF
jgi:hypothetical protein